MFDLMKAQMSFNLGLLGSTTRSLDQIKEIIKGTLKVPFSVQLNCLNLGRLESYTSSVGKIKGIPCQHSRMYDLCSIDQFSSQLGNKFVLTVIVQLTLKLGQIHFVRKLTQVTDQGQSWPSSFITFQYRLYQVHHTSFVHCFEFGTSKVLSLGKDCLLIRGDHFDRFYFIQFTSGLKSFTTLFVSKNYSFFLQTQLVPKC